VAAKFCNEQTGSFFWTAGILCKNKTKSHSLALNYFMISMRDLEMVKKEISRKIKLYGIKNKVIFIRVYSFKQWSDSIRSCIKENNNLYLYC
jgi:hypothetical protein